MPSDGGIEVRPPICLAPAYDHRVIDGRDTVSFLVRMPKVAMVAESRYALVNSQMRDSHMATPRGAIRD